MLEYDADSALIGPEGAGREKGKQKNQSLRRNMSRPRPTAIIESVGNPFDRVWAPTTSGELQPIFAYIDSRGGHPFP
jgi:hypothetical protein